MITFNPETLQDACDLACLFINGERTHGDPAFVMHEVLWKVGFDSAFDDGLFYVHSYEGRLSMDEDKLFAGLVPFIRDGGEFYWESSEGTQWQWEFDGGRMYSRDVICTAGPREEVFP